jgi:hypothetical protein
MGVVYKRYGYILTVPEEVNELYKGTERALLENAIEQLRIIQKVASYRLRGFRHSIRFTWHGLHPRIIIEVKVFPDDVNEKVVEIQRKRREEMRKRASEYLEKLEKQR